MLERAGHVLERAGHVLKRAGHVLERTGHANRCAKEQVYMYTKMLLIPQQAAAFLLHLNSKQHLLIKPHTKIN